MEWDATFALLFTERTNEDCGSVSLRWTANQPTNQIGWMGWKRMCMDEWIGHVVLGVLRSASQRILSCKYIYLAFPSV